MTCSAHSIIKRKQYCVNFFLDTGASEQRSKNQKTHRVFEKLPKKRSDEYQKKINQNSFAVLGSF